VAAANLPGGPNQTFHIPSGGSISRVAGLDGDGPSWLANRNLQVGGAVLFATKSKSDKTTTEIPGPRKTRYVKSTRRPAAIWRHNHFPLYTWAMVVGGKHLALAGPPAELPPDDPWGGLEGRAGGKLRILESETGTPVRKVDLDAPPMWDGMAVASGRLFVTMKDGSVNCLGE